MHEFLLMDGYYAYVWGAWGLTFFTMVGLAIAARRHHRQALEEATRDRDLPGPGRVAVKELS